FYQVAAPERSKAGLGLGLAIVDRLGAMLGHPITVASTLGKGSRFSITVPKAPAHSAAAAVIAPRTTPPGHLRDKLVVVIDDDALTLEGTGGLLRSWGCRVVTGQSDREALTKLNGSTPDLIISDYHLREGRSGVEAISELRDAFGGQI